MAISRRSNPGPEIEAVVIGLSLVLISAEEVLSYTDDDGNPVNPDLHPFPPDCLPSNLPSLRPGKIPMTGPEDHPEIIKKRDRTLDRWRSLGVDVPTGILFSDAVVQCMLNSPILWSIYWKMIEDLAGDPPLYLPRNAARGLLWMYRFLYELYRRCPAARTIVLDIIKKIRELDKDYPGRIPPIYKEPWPPGVLHPSPPSGPNFGEPWAPFPKMPQPPGDGCPELPVLPDPPPPGVTGGTSFDDPAFKI